MTRRPASPKKGVPPIPTRPPSPCTTPRCPHRHPCPIHKRPAWQGSKRRQQLPSNWEALRGATRRRANGRCEHVNEAGERCKQPGNECDHIVPGNNHHPTNLQWLCSAHHAAKTQAEAAAARRANQQHKQQRPQG